MAEYRYVKYLEMLADSYLQDFSLDIEKFSPNAMELEDIDPVVLLEEIRRINKLITGIENYTPAKFQGNVVAGIKSSFIDEINSHSEKLASNDANYLQEAENVRQRKATNVKQATDALNSYVERKTAEIESQLKYYNALKKREPEVVQLLRMYKLDADGYVNDLSNCEIDEVESECKVALESLNVVTRNPRFLHKITQLAYYPLLMDNLTEIQTKIVKICWAISFALLCYIGRPYFLACIAFCYYVDCASNFIGIREKKKILQMVYATLNNDIDISIFVEDAPEYYELIANLEEAENEDIQPELDEIEKQRLQAEEEIKSQDPTKLMEEELKAWEDYKESSSYRDFIFNIEAKVNATYNMYVKELHSYRDKLELTKEKMKEDVAEIGTTISMSEALEPGLLIGEVRDDEGTVISQIDLTTGNRNVVFKYKDEDNRLEVVRYMKLLLCNYLCNIREKHMNISIYDNEDLGRDFYEFTNISGLDKYLHIYEKGLKDKLNSLYTNVLMRNGKLGDKDIYTYNTEAQKICKMTLDYELVIILSAEENLYKDEKFRRFLEYSDKKGIIVWLVTKDESLIEDDETRKLAPKFLKGLDTVTDYGVYIQDGCNIAELPDGWVPYQYNIQLGMKVGATYSDCVRDKNRNASALLYEKMFRPKFIPEEDIWKACTNDGVKLLFGLEDGDPDKPVYYTLGDANVHMLMGGATGAGKSACINQFLASLLYTYSPEELELVMVDFKNIEFKMYTGKYQIPHTSIIAGTKDGEYAISIFQYLYDEMLRRTDLMGQYQINKLPLYNNLMREQGREKDILPRIVVLIDEFQTMFTTVDPKSLEQIKTLITNLTKLARFCGVHLVFTSQSMKGTMSKDILDNFSLRAALRCTAEVSSEIIGNDASSKFKEKFGWLTTNDSAAQDPTVNRTVRVPFINPDEIHSYIQMMQKKCRDEGHINRMAEYYDEDEVHSEDDLRRRLTEYKKDFADDEECFILGEKTRFTVSKKPDNFIVAKGYDENILFCGFERSAQCNMINTFVEQLNAKGVSYVVQCQDIELAEVLGLYDKVPEDVQAYISDEVTTEDIIENLEELLALRQSDPEECETPMYFMGIDWDNLVGISIKENARLTARLENLVHMGPKYNIHFIIIVSSAKKLRSIKSMCKHIIAAYCDETESTNLIGTPKANKIPPKVAIYKYGNDMYKFKIYEFKLKREFRARTKV